MRSGRSDISPTEPRSCRPRKIPSSVGYATSCSIWSLLAVGELRVEQFGPRDLGQVAAVADLPFVVDFAVVLIKSGAGLLALRLLSPASVDGA